MRTGTKKSEAETDCNLAKKEAPIRTAELSIMPPKFGKDAADLPSRASFDIHDLGGVKHVKASADVFDETSDAAELNSLRELLYG